MIMNEWNEDDKALEPHDDNDDGWSMGMMAMSEDGQDAVSYTHLTLPKKA